MHDLAFALTRLADLGLAARRRTGRVARAARDVARDLDVLRRAPHRFRECQLEIEAQVGAARLARTPATTAEEIAEQIAERREDVLDVGEAGTAGATAAALEPVEAVAIVDGALLVIAEDLVRVRRFLELLFGGFVVGVLVGMELLREPAICLLQIGLARATLDSQDFIEITHGASRISSLGNAGRPSCQGMVPP